jgi:hypothetical protein
LSPRRRLLVEIAEAYDRTGLSGRKAADHPYMVEPSDRPLEARRTGGVALSETTVGVLIGAGATVAGSLVTGLLAFLVDSRRRRWEDKRRWDEPRRHAYATYLEAARWAQAVADTLLEALIHLDRSNQLFKAVEEQREDQPDVADVVKLRADLEAFVARAARASSQSEEALRRLDETAAVIYLIASRPVQDAVEGQVELLHRFLSTPRTERRSWTAEKLHAMREELGERWWDTSEDFQRVVAEELRMEPRRALRRRRAR